MNNLAGIILAAGKGTRMKSRASNKVTLPLAGKPMILYALELLKSLEISPIVIVVGFAKQSVKEVIKDNVIFAEQKKRLGTAHALMTGIKELQNNVSNVLVVQGDDAAFYKKETLEKLVETHIGKKNAMTFLTVEVSDPSGLGRIIRDEHNSVAEIIEEKNATTFQTKIHEINPGCYVFSLSFLRKYLPKVPKNEKTGEYYLVSLLKIAKENKEKAQDVKGGFMPWRGVNTKEELEKAHELLSN